MKTPSLFSADTSPEFQALLMQRLRAMSPTEKFERMFKLSSMAEQFVMAGIQQRHADESSVEHCERYLKIMAGSELAQRWHNSDLRAKDY